MDGLVEPAPRFSQRLERNAALLDRPAVGIRLGYVHAAPTGPLAYPAGFVPRTRLLQREQVPADRTQLPIHKNGRT